MSTRSKQQTFLRFLLSFLISFSVIWKNIDVYDDHYQVKPNKSILDGCVCVFSFEDWNTDKWCEAFESASELNEHKRIEKNDPIRIGSQRTKGHLIMLFLFFLTKKKEEKSSNWLINTSAHVYRTIKENRKPENSYMFSCVFFFTVDFFIIYHTSTCEY